MYKCILFTGVMLLLFTQMDKSIPFLVILILVGLLIISIDVFPNPWDQLNSIKIFGGNLIKIVKGLALSLSGCALCLRINQNMSEITDDNKFDKSFEVTMNLIIGPA